MNQRRLKFDGAMYAVWRYTWDYENRMAEAATRKQKVRYKFDALGRRVQRIVGSGKENTKFIHDGLDALVDGDSGTLTKYLNGEGIDNKLRVQQGSTVNYFLADHLGSTNGLADSSGAVTSQTAYDSFGNQTGTLPTRYGFTGRERDDFSGLMYYRARFYDPKLGRFTSEDPIGFGGGDINLYGYVLNRPIMLRDPSGKIVPVIIGGGIGITILILASPSPVNAPGPTSPVYYPDNPLILNAAGGYACSYFIGRFVSPFIARLLSGGVRPGMKVYRVWGRNPDTPDLFDVQSGPYGSSWTPTNPNSVTNFRGEAGLPDGNLGRFMTEGFLTDTAGVTLTRATRIGSNAGGLPELVIPDPATQIVITSVKGVTPSL